MRSLCLRWVLVAGFGLALGGCGDNGSGPSSGPLQGRFVDGVVTGLDWSFGGGSGVTGSQGEFTYANGENVQFAVGAIPLGEGRGEPWMTPVDVVAGASDETHPTVANIARFLQTIDDDNDLGNGIQITDAIRSAASGQSVSFALTTGAFGTDPGVLQAISDMTKASTAGERPLRDVQAAQTELARTLLGILSGHYEGEIRDNSGATIGSLSLDVEALGSVSGVYQLLEGSPVQVTGSLGSDGSLQAAGADGTDFLGQIAWPTNTRLAPVLTLMGGWFNSSGQTAGSVEAVRTGDI